MPPNYKRKLQANQAIPDLEQGLPKLTSKQESFVQSLLQGKSPIDAYRLAYNASGMTEASCNTESWRLRQNPAIAQSLRFFQRIGLESGKVSVENHLNELARLRELAVDATQISAGVQAEHYRGRVAGLYNDKLQLQVGPSDSALLAQLALILGPEAAQAIARGLGVENAATGEPEASGEALLLAKPSDLER